MLLNNIPKDFFTFIGIGIAVIVGAFVYESVKIFANKIFRNGYRNRRREDDDWTIKFLESMNGLNVEFKDLKSALLNGLRHDLDEIKQTIQHCEKVTYNIEHESKRNR